MRLEELGPITDQELYEAVCAAEVVETYPEDRPFPSVLIYGSTGANRPFHAVFAYDAEDDRAVVITVYQPDPAQWEDYRRRRR